MHPNVFQIARMLVRSQPCCKRNGRSIFCDFCSHSSWQNCENAPLMESASAHLRKHRGHMGPLSFNASYVPDRTHRTSRTRMLSPSRDIVILWGSKMVAM